MGSRRWTKKETQYLYESWGSIFPETIAKKVGRTVTAVKYKAYKEGLDDIRLHLNGVTVYQLSQVLNRSTSCVANYIKLYGLPVSYFRVSDKQRVKYITYDNWWKWAERNKEKIDFRDLERLSMGPEPKWVNEQRKQDEYDLKKQKYGAEWTVFEVVELKRMLQTYSFTVYEIAERFNRTPVAISAKIKKLGILLRPVPKEGSRKRWTVEETLILSDMLLNDKSIYEIAERLNKSTGAVYRKIRRG